MLRLMVHAHKVVVSSGLLFMWLGGVALTIGDAATLVVTSLADPGDGTCTKAECTLREAITQAHAGDTITFAPALFTTGPGTIVLRAGELVLWKDLRLVGPGRHLLAISGNQSTRVVRIDSNVTASIAQVTLKQGHRPVVPYLLYDGGGGVRNDGTLTITHSTLRGNTSDREGGGVYNLGTLTIQHSTLRGNTVYRGGGSSGGGVYNLGTLTIRHSTLSGNTAYSSSGGGGGVLNSGTLTIQYSTLSGNTAGQWGGGVLNSGTLTIRRSTLYGNTARIGGGVLNNSGATTITHSTISGNFGGGVLNFVLGTLTIRESTISGNMVTGDGGGVANVGTTVKLSGTILAGNTASTTDRSDCYQGQPIQSRGHNLTGTNTGCPSDPSRGDALVNPAVVFTQVLKPLRNNGGPTKTHALWPGSPALDAGDPAACSGTDQRGVTRPQGASCDIGAFELEVP